MLKKMQENVQANHSAASRATGLKPAPAASAPPLAPAKAPLAMLVAIAAAFVIALAGCSSTTGEDSASYQAAEPSDGSIENLFIGEKTSTSLDIVLINELGADITAVAVSTSNAPDDFVTLTEGDQVVKVGEQARLNVEPQDAALFNVAITCGDATYVLHDLDIVNIDVATVRLEGDIAYATFDVDGVPYSSLQDEYDRANPPADEGAADQPAAGAEPVASYSQPAVTYAEPASAAEAAPAQSEDACVSDVILE